MSRIISAPRVAALVGAFDRSPAYRGLADALRRLVTDGRVAVGVRLPSERDLADALGVSRTTVTRAYDDLRELGYLASRQGSGSVAALPGSAFGYRGDHLLPPGVVAPDGAIDLTVAAPAAPPGTMAAFEAAVRMLPGHLGATGYSPSGLPELREAIAARYDARGLPTSPDQVIVTAGALAGLAVAARAVAGRGDRALVESPTYPNAIATLEHAGTRVAGIDVDHTGWDVAQVEATVLRARPRLAYLIPDFHNPTGALMPERDRARIGAALTRAGSVAIVDESLVELRLDPLEMPPPFACHAAGAISIGSLSKSFWGGLRIGWVRAPEELVTACFKARLSLDLGAALLEQLVAVELLADPGEVLAERRRMLRRSRTAAVTALAAHLPEWRVPDIHGGLALWCELPEPLSTTLALAAEPHGVLLAAGPAFAPEGGYDRFLRIPLTQPADVLTDAVRRLAPAWDDARSGRLPTSPNRGAAPASSPRPSFPQRDRNPVVA
jgi:DNA-binding transcriptional MocR family regulator